MDVSDVDLTYLLGRSSPNFSVQRLMHESRVQAGSRVSTVWPGGGRNTVNAWMANCPNFWRPPQANVEIANSRRSASGTGSVTVQSGWVTDAAQFLTAARGNYVIH